MKVFSIIIGFGCMQFMMNNFTGWFEMNKKESGKHVMVKNEDWSCGRCGHSNSGWTSICGKCGRSR